MYAASFCTLKTISLEFVLMSVYLSTEKKIVLDFDWNIFLWLDLWLEYDFDSLHERKQ